MSIKMNAKNYIDLPILDRIMDLYKTTTTSTTTTTTTTTNFIMYHSIIENIIYLANRPSRASPQPPKPSVALYS